MALARPVEEHAEGETTIEGIDIVLAMDISGSMLAQDFKPNRIESSKSIASEFVADRQGDRLSIVAFAGEAFTQCPLTSDRSAVQTSLSRLRSGPCLVRFAGQLSIYRQVVSVGWNHIHMATF